MGVLIIRRGELMEHIRFLRDNNIPFTFSVNNLSFRVESDYGTYLATDNLIPRRQLGFVKKVKAYIIKNKIYKKIPNKFSEARKNKINYFNYIELKRNKLFKKNIYEIDLNQAYWLTAQKIGLLTEELFQEGFKVTKKARLASIGSLAKRTKVYEFNGQKMKYSQTVSQTQTEHLWYAICEYLGNVMKKAKVSTGKDFIFFWVDAIFVVGKSATKAVQKSFKESGYDSKVMKIKSVKFNLKTKEIIVIGKGRQHKKERKFPLAGLRETITRTISKSDGRSIKGEIQKAVA